MPTKIQSFVSYFDLKIDNQQVPQTLLGDLLDCTVENSLHLPDLCSLRMYDAEFQWMDSASFTEGKSVQVMVGMEGSSGLTKIFHGEITGLEVDMTAEGVPTLLVHAMNRAHRLHRGRSCNTFVQMTDSDIVNKVGAAAGFTMICDSTTVVHEWVMQDNLTHWAFLSERARRNGCRLYVKDEKELHFKKVTNDAATTVTLKWGTDLRSFRPRTLASPQVDEVSVRGWDPATKKAIVGSSQTPVGTPQASVVSSGRSAASQTFGNAKMVVVDRPVHSQSEADALALSISDDIGGMYLEAEGLCYGNAALQPGVTVDISNVGTRFSGKYFVTSTQHTYSSAEGYSTLFTVSGKRASNLLSLLDDESGGRTAPLGGNIVIGLVTDNNDPDKLGRVKVKYPWLTEDHASHWARIASPMAGSSRGFYFLPEINDEVLVAFEHGDIRRPYIIGALWNKLDQPIEGNDVAVVNQKVVHRTIKTRVGHTILLDDTDETGEIKLKTNGGHFLQLNDADKHITAKTTSGHKILLDDQNDQIVIVDKSTNNKVTIKTGDNSMKLECLGNFDIDSKGKVTIQGVQGIEMKTPQKVQMQGAAGIAAQSGGTMDLQAVGMTSLQTTAILTIQGSLVKIN